MAEPLLVEKIQVYDCPNCNDRIVGTIQEAKTHVNIPLGRGLIFPKGFVFGERDIRGIGEYSRMKIWLINGAQQISHDRAYEIGPYFVRYGTVLTTHDFQYSAEKYKLKKEQINAEEETHKWLREENNYKYTPLIQRNFRRGIYFLLNRDQFEDFKNYSVLPNPDPATYYTPLSNNELIRTIRGFNDFLSCDVQLNQPLSIPKD